jgi:probable HAF family extracellular repeat protein
MVYRITELNVSTAALNQNVAYDLNDNVQIAGDVFAVADMPSGFMRDTSGAITWTPSGADGRQTSNRAISSLGSVAGYIHGKGQPTQAFRWSASAGTSALSIGDESAAFGINNTGDVAGSYRVGTDRRAFFWDRFGATYDLGKLDDSSFAQTFAYAVNDSQQVVGAATTGDGFIHAFIWSPSTGMRSLFPGQQNSGAYAISNYGRITGFLQDKKGGWEVFIYDLKTGINEIYGPFKHVSFANGIDESGVAVGQSDGKATLFLSLRAFDLNQMIDGGTPWTLTTAYAINNQGQIVAAGTLNGVTRSFLLTPLF